MSNGPATPARSTGRELAVCLGLIALYTAWYWPGVGGGKVYFDEDVAAVFYTWRASLYGLADGAGWSWWNPLPGLGTPRFGNIMAGHFSPVSALFYLVPTPVAYGIYPVVVMSLLSCFTYALFRACGLLWVPALFGALSWSSLAAITTHFQHPAYMETILWLPATLLAWELYVRSRAGIWAAIAGVTVAFQCFGASPQYLLYNFLVMAAWFGLSLWHMRSEPHRLARSTLAAAGVVIVGLGLASWQLLPAMEFADHSHRSLLYATQEFADHYRATPGEIGLALVAEIFTIIEAPLLVHGGGLYRTAPNLSLVTVAFALLALVYRPRKLVEWLIALFFLVGMLGSVGGVTTLLESVFPLAERLRAPNRMLIPAAFWIAWLAAYGMSRWLETPSRTRSWIALAAVLWLVVLGWNLRRPADRYVEPEFFAIPESIRSADGRISLDLVGSRQPPLFAINAGLAADKPTLMTRDALWPRNFWEAIYASQFGSLQNSAHVDRAITTAILPLRSPGLPLLRSYGLRSLIRYNGGTYQVLSVPNPVEENFVVRDLQLAATPPERWALAASSAWDPSEQAIVSSPIPELAHLASDHDSADGAVETTITTLQTGPDSQVLEVTSDGGLLVTSSLYFPGWSVRVDGRSTDIHEVNLALRGVVIPPGRHQVEWRYEPTWKPQAIIASLVALGVALALTLGFRPSKTSAPLADG